jgi:hypothetical protein
VKNTPQWLNAAGLVGCVVSLLSFEELMHQMNQPKMAHVLPSEGEEGDDPPEPTD